LGKKHPQSGAGKRYKGVGGDGKRKVPSVGGRDSATAHTLREGPKFDTTKNGRNEGSKLENGNYIGTRKRCGKQEVSRSSGGQKNVG